MTDELPIIGPELPPPMALDRLMSKALFTVSACRDHWAAEGNDFMVASADRTMRRIAALMDENDEDVGSDAASAS